VTAVKQRVGRLPGIGPAWRTIAATTSFRSVAANSSPDTPGDCHCPCCAQYPCPRCNTYCVDDHGYTCWNNCGLGCS